MPRISNIDSLIQRLDKMYPQAYDRTNYGELIKSMENMDNAVEILILCEEIHSEISDYPYECYCPELLISYANECIRDCYKRDTDNSIKTFSEAYINIRKSKNAKQIKEEIVQIAKEKGLEVDEKISDMEFVLKNYKRLEKKMVDYGEGTNGYNSLCPQMKEYLQYLFKHGYYCNTDYSDCLFSEDLFDFQKEVFEDDVKKSDLKWGCGLFVYIICCICCAIWGFKFFGISLVVIALIIVYLFCVRKLKQRNKEGVVLKAKLKQPRLQNHN